VVLLDWENWREEGLNELRLCTNCNRLASFELVTRTEMFRRGNVVRVIDVEYTRCKECGDEVLDPSINPDPFLKLKEVSEINENKG